MFSGISGFFELYYASARVRALRGMLIPAEILDEIKSSRTKEELVSHLNKTPYESAFTGNSIEGIESKIDSELVRTIKRIALFLPKKFSDDFGKYALRYDLLNIKTILRGMHANIPHDEIKKDLIPAGNIWEKALSEPLKDMESLRPFLSGTIWEKASSDAVSKYRETGLLSSAEYVFDAFYISVLERIKTESLSVFVKLEIEMIDALTMARLEAGNITINSGGLNYVLLGKTAPKDGAVENIKNGSPEDNIEKALLGNARRLMLKDPFGIGLYIEYIRRKETEARLLKSCARKLWA